MEMTKGLLTETLGLLKTWKALTHIFGFEICQFCLGREKLREILRRGQRYRRTLGLPFISDLQRDLQLDGPFVKKKEKQIH